MISPTVNYDALILARTSAKRRVQVGKSSMGRRPQIPPDARVPPGWPRLFCDTLGREESSDVCPLQSGQPHREGRAEPISIPREPFAGQPIARPFFTDWLRGTTFVVDDRAIRPRQK